MKKALITGITGQDGYFLSQFLLEKGYEVYGLARRNSQKSLGSLEYLPKEIKNQIKIYWGDITDYFFVEKVIKENQFDEIYHLAAQSFVHLSFDNPKLTYDVNIGGTLNIVNAIKEYSPKSKLYFAATSELFGKVREVPQNENTPFYPRSPYAVSKLAGFWTIKNYRESHNLFMSNGILFNHESEMRGPEFVTRKISLGAAKVHYGLQKFIELGNLDAKRDWGYAKDYIEGMWKILQYEKSDDFVLATGENHSIREFIKEAFHIIGKEIIWEGEGVNEFGKDKETGDILIKVNPAYFRPAEVEHLIGDISKAKQGLDWEPKTKFKDLVKLMVESDLKRVRQETNQNGR